MFEDAYPVLKEIARLLSRAWQTMRAWDTVTLLLLGIVIGFFIAIGLGSLRGSMRAESKLDSQTKGQSQEEYIGSLAELGETCA